MLEEETWWEWTRRWRSLKSCREPRVAGKTRGRLDSDTGNRTPGYRVRGDNVSHYTISDIMSSGFVSIDVYS